MRIAVLSMALVFCGCALRAEDAPKDYGADLAKTLAALDTSLASGTTEEKRTELKAILPTQADMETLFPSKGALLWKAIGPHLQNMLAHIDEVAAEMTRRQWTNYKTINIRTDDTGKRYEKVFAVIPKDIPVYRVIREAAAGSGGSSTYLYVHGRWIFIQGFEEIPNAIRMLEEGAKPVSRGSDVPVSQDGTAPSAPTPKDAPAGKQADRP